MPLRSPLKFAIRKSRLRKSRNCTIGCFIRGSMMAKRIKLIRPMTIIELVAGGLRIGNASILKPSNTPVRPILSVNKPNQSMRWCFANVTGSRRRQIPQITPKIPSGTLNRKTQRHDHSVSKPPMTGPIKKPAAPAIWLMPRPNPTRPLRKASVTMAVLFVTNKAPPTPWMRRPRMRSAPWNRGWARPATSEPRTNTANPLLYSRLRPHISARRPTTGVSTVVTRRYPNKTHMIVKKVACRSAIILGSAISSAEPCIEASSAPTVVTESAVHW